MREGIDRAIEEVAQRQAGAFSRAQLRQVGGTDRQRASRVARGTWTGEAPGVYALSSWPVSIERRLWVAVLATGAGAVASHEAAAALRGLTGFPLGPVVVTIAHGRHQRLRGVTVHQSRDLLRLDHHVTTLRGMPITTIERTFVDLAAVTGREKLAVALDDAVAARLTSMGAVGRCLLELTRPGKKGIEKLRDVLAERGPGYVPSASALERRLHDAIEAAGDPPLVRQHPFPGQRLPHGCVDGAYPDALLIVEADSRRWHTRVADVARDRFRDNEAARAGWLVLRVLHENLRDDPEGTARLIRETRAMRLHQLLPRPA